MQKLLAVVMVVYSSPVEQVQCSTALLICEPVLLLQQLHHIYHVYLCVRARCIVAVSHCRTLDLLASYESL